jgi:hypothetical protein
VIKFMIQLTQCETNFVGYDENHVAISSFNREKPSNGILGRASCLGGKILYCNNFQPF